MTQDHVGDQEMNWELPSFQEDIMAAKNTRFALVIPVLNEGDRIRQQLLRIQAMGLPTDVILADGGSTDGSTEREFLQNAGVRAVLTKTGEGRLSAQLRIAYAWCIRQGYDGIITVDGNGKDGVEAVLLFVEQLERGFDYVQGSRYLSGGGSQNTPLERTIANRLIHAPILSLAGRHWFTDTTNGFRAYSTRYLLHPNVQPFRDIFLRYELLFYLTVRAGQLGLRVCQVPVKREYPAGEATPTKISGFYGKLHLLMQTLRVALGAYTP